MTKFKHDTSLVRSLVKWEREMHTAGSRELLEVLEKVTRELLQHPRYKDDRRYLRMWMLYVRLPSLNRVFCWHNHIKVVTLLHRAGRPCYGPITNIQATPGTRDNCLHGVFHASRVSILFHCMRFLNILQHNR